MTIITIVFWTVCLLWSLVTACAIIVIRDLLRPPSKWPTPVTPMPLPIGTWFDNISINQRGGYQSGGMRWRAARDDEIGQMMTIRHIPPPQLTPETERALQIMRRMRDEQYLRIEHAMIYGSNAARRCDICGAMTAEQKTERCRNACGQIHGGKTTAVLCIDAGSWTGRSGR